MGKGTVLAVAVAAMLAAGLSSTRAAPSVWSPPEPVRIEGYSGDAMEPFLSRGGNVLFFNTRNDPATDTDIHYALRRDDLTFVHQGILAGTKSPSLDGVPTMARDGTFCFISPRDYFQTLSSVFCGRFGGSAVADVTAQTGMKTAHVGRLVFDVEISADGQELAFAEGDFSGGAAPDSADIYLAVRSGNGFARTNSHVFDKVNSDALEYAPALSDDGLELFFTRMTGFWIFRQTQIFRAVRATRNDAFGEPVHVPIEGFVEAATVSSDGHAIYFHKLVDGRFGIWRMTRK
jgi:hypothetical protein